MSDAGSLTFESSPTALAAFRSGFQAAAASSGGVVRMPISLGGFRAVFCFAGPALLPRLGAPFEHLRIEDGPEDLLIRVWDSESTGIPLPAELPSTRSVYAQSLPAMSDQGDVRWTYFRPDPGLSAYDAPAMEADYWVPAASCLTYGDLAGGFRAIIAWSMAERGMQFLHSAAIAVGDVGALIVGASGSGKSSTSLTCLLAGMDYLGDDHCLLDLGDEPRVHSIYGAAKLHTAQLERFPELDRFIVNGDRIVPEKAVAILHPDFQGQLPISKPLSVVLVPRITGGIVTTIEPIGPAAALAALAPSTLLQMASADRSGLAAMGRLVRRVPSFRVNLGTEREEIAEVISQFLVGRSGAGS